ncbi:Oidioi.mRNA.OKI2018_I69.chr1.g1645.t1.cds [Oikopleura dioica]|uniref:Oidioi.mRNA.OKI2018_I69.chr1.g1645.t1.cds n=1 Tax=Oikopleura dioica TaxID=34765 RepID=A0ABN7SNJ9_OIKDI|nr:Oidioi.mRNA.OKI2018_I69.chr1.g1645.t1.cds [Oikopleura dioica]
MKFASIFFPALAQAMIGQLEGTLQCFTCGQTDFFSFDSYDSFDDSASLQCQTTITQKHLKPCPRATDVCKTRITRTITVDDVVSNTSIVAIERSCAAKEETPEQFKEEMRYLEHYPSEEDPRIQTEIEEVFCTKDGCNFHEAENYYKPSKIEQLFLPQIDEPESSASSILFSFTLFLALAFFM